MGFQKLLLSAATACLLLGTSGTAMAVECNDDAITDDVVPSIEVTSGTCILVDVRVQGRVEVSGAASFVMIASDAGGRIRVEGTNLVYIANTRLTQGNFIVRDSGLVSLLDNDLRSGSMVVNRNGDATVNRNDVRRNLTCRNNGSLTSLLNAVEGDEDCPL